MEKVMFLSIEGYRHAVLVIGICSSVYLDHNIGVFSSQLHMFLRNTDEEIGSFSHTCVSEEQHSFCII